MLTFYHSPMTRSTCVLTLLAAMDALDRVEVREVAITRFDGSGRADPANPHPEGKVPLLVQDGVAIWESAAILLYLTDLFPEAGLGVPAGDPRRGRYLSWLAWYAGVMEPVLIHEAAGLAHPYLAATFRGPAEVRDRLAKALADGPWLVGDRYTAADLLVLALSLVRGHRPGLRAHPRLGGALRGASGPGRGAGVGRADARGLTLRSRAGHARAARPDHRWPPPFGGQTQ